jgi:hypothetical protein
MNNNDDFNRTRALLAPLASAELHAKNVRGGRSQRAMLRELTTREPVLKRFAEFAAPVFLSGSVAVYLSWAFAASLAMH